VNKVKHLVEGIDPLLHEGGRLAIVSTLAAVAHLSFQELRDMMEMTDGNLSIHLQKLQKAGYISIHKEFIGRRPHTSCALTPAGRAALVGYLDRLEAIVRQGRRQTRA
jgi:DNA-binding transcriptional ArsR family regulator